MKDNRDINCIELLNMEFYSYHGCFEEERIIGNRFIVDFTAYTDITKASLSDDLKDALNYQELYNVIKKEMETKSHLLENVAMRILESSSKRFPSIKRAKVTVAKLNPPIGGKVGSSRVTMSRIFDRDGE